MKKRVDKGTTRVGYKNRNGQRNLGRSEPVKAGMPTVKVLRAERRVR